VGLLTTGDLILRYSGTAGCPTWPAPSTAYRGSSSIAFAASLRIARHLADHDRGESSQYHAAWCTKPCIAWRIVVNFNIDAKLSDPYHP